MKRIAFLDYVRVFACFLVILVHVCESYYGVSDGEMACNQSYLANEWNRLWVSVYDGFSRMAVPLFIIISAYLLVPLKEEESMWSFYKRRFMRVVPPFVVFMILYSTLPMVWGQLTAEESMFDLSRVALNFPSLAGHLWFMYPLLSIYLFAPMISPWLRRASAREELFFVAIFVVSTFLPYINYFWGDAWGQCFWNEFHMLWYFSGYLGYVVLAHFIRKHLAWSGCKRLWIGLALVVVGGFVTIYSFYMQAEPGRMLDTVTIELGWRFCTPNVLMLTAGAFLMFSAIKEHKESRLLVTTSKLTYGIYLMHIFWLFFWVGLIKESMNTVVEIPLAAVATFVSCWITAKLISYIPGHRYVIG